VLKKAGFSLLRLWNMHNSKNERIVSRETISDTPRGYNPQTRNRNKAVFAQGGSWYISEFSEADLPKYGIGESEYQGLWKKYFETIAIRERVNPSCQKRFMPVRYWKNLTELR
jgi:hypothetical protein